MGTHPFLNLGTSYCVAMVTELLEYHIAKQFQENVLLFLITLISLFHCMTHVLHVMSVEGWIT